MATNSNRCSCAFCSGLAARPMLFADNGVGFAGADHGIFDLTATRRVDRSDALFGNNEQPWAGNTLRFIASDVSSWPAVNTDYGASPFTGPSVTTADLMAGPQPAGRGLPGVDPLTGGIASNDDSGIPLSILLDDNENETPWPAPVRDVDVSAASAAAAGSSAPGGTAPAAAVTPSLAPNAGQEQIIQWMTGLKADGTTTSSSFWSTSKTGVSWSWGTGSRTSTSSS